MKKQAREEGEGKGERKTKEGGGGEKERRERKNSIPVLSALCCLPLFSSTLLLTNLVGRDTGHGDRVGRHMVAKAGREDGFTRHVAGADLEKKRDSAATERDKYK